MDLKEKSDLKVSNYVLYLFIIKFYMRPFSWKFLFEKICDLRKSQNVIVLFWRKKYINFYLFKFMWDFSEDFWNEEGRSGSLMFRIYYL